ncbi:MAG TPA: chromate efflux transporter [Rhizomicrobium sp.]|jgi:chromate transporter
MDETGVPPSSPPPVPFSEAVRTWARVAALSFGGPAGQIAVMHRILVQEKRWIGEERFLHALNYCMLLPGPEAHELAIYIGWLMHRVRGGLVAGILFVLPGLVALTALSVIYGAFGHIGFVQALFFGLKAAVLAIVLQAVMRVGKRALKTPLLIGLAASAFVAIFAFGLPFPLIVLGAGLIGYVCSATGWLSANGGHAHAAASPGGEPALIDAQFADGIPPHVRPSALRSAIAGAVGATVWLAPLVVLLLAFGPRNVFTAIALFNSKMAVITFGGAYAVLAYMAQQAVEHYHWLRPGEMLVGLGFAETTPGPLISVVDFVGFMAAFRQPGVLTPVLAGILGGALAMWSTFVPPFIWIFAGGPYVEALIGNRRLKAALSAITAAVVGVIVNLAVWFALHTMFAQVGVTGRPVMALPLPVWGTIDWAALILCAAAAIATFRFKTGMLATFCGCSAAGLIYYLATGAT